MYFYSAVKKGYDICLKIIPWIPKYFYEIGC